MTHMVTRCPKCATAFRVTATQLESAKGSVRCGSCLHIFKAHDDLINTAVLETKQTTAAVEQESAPIDSPATPSDVTPAYSKIDLDDDFLISDDMDEPSISNSSYEFEGYMDVDLTPTKTVSLFERNMQLETERADDEVDESWADELLESDQELLKALESSAVKTEKSPAKVADSTIVDKQTPHDLSSAIMERHAIEVPDAREYARINEEFSNLNKTPLFSIVNDASAQKENPIPEESFFNASNHEHEFGQEQPNESTTFGTGFFRHRDDQDLLHTQKHSLKSQPAVHANQDSRATLLMNIAPSPIELTAQRLRSWWQNPHWTALSLVAVLILILQIAYFKFDQLSRIDPYRSAYLWACPILNCKLVDTSKIIAYQLVLRNHPEAKNALLLDVMIRNDAPFAQPFPDLILSFTTLDEKPVASRRFKAKEYVGGEIAGMEHIPSKRPVHVTLELSDPGPEAVNYHMAIAP